MEDKQKPFHPFPAPVYSHGIVGSFQRGNKLKKHHRLTRNRVINWYRAG